jgi:hypothetical protein
MPSSPASASAALPVPINLGALCSNGGLRSGPGRARRGGEEKEKSIGLIRNGAGLVTIPATHAHHHPSRWTASKEKTHQTLGPDVRNEPGRPASRDVTWGGGGRGCRHSCILHSSTDHQFFPEACHKRPLLPPLGSAWLCVAPSLGFCPLGEAQRLPSLATYLVWGNWSSLLCKHIICRRLVAGHRHGR